MTHISKFHRRYKFANPYRFYIDLKWFHIESRNLRSLGFCKTLRRTCYWIPNHSQWLLPGSFRLFLFEIESAVTQMILHKPDAYTTLSALPGCQIPFQNISPLIRNHLTEKTCYLEKVYLGVQLIEIVQASKHFRWNLATSFHLFNPVFASAVNWISRNKLQGNLIQNTIWYPSDLKYTTWYPSVS